MFDFLKKKKPDKKSRVAAIITAAGSSTRMNGVNKQFSDILGAPVLAYTLRAFEATPCIDEIIVTAREEDILLVYDIIREYDISKASSVVTGGDTRQKSVKIGIDAAGECHIIAIHDGARPCILPEHIELAVSAAERYGAAAVGCPVADTLKLVGENSFIATTLDRKGIWHIQTPQVFKSGIIKAAHDNAQSEGIEATDDCALVERAGYQVYVVLGDSGNIKITTPQDLFIARGIIESRGDFK
ncbi:MAG: 2-C-methyl-D-erythritol 4-phosphate cytidylyltransferase [Firmicutes bacterium ADurb.Bin193]|nr:MAG: 2-C-methyl-D-erythritol 4-phosphate cytidylyltransferase [Firmicutes bacterium ADurb.Bin193]